jgi:hypothetical protein
MANIKIKTGTILPRHHGADIFFGEEYFFLAFFFFTAHIFFFGTVNFFRPALLLNSSVLF